MRREQTNAVAVVSFYPEGGAWVAGASQNIAFEANDADGKHLQGHLRVQDKDGKVLAEADTEHQGRGMVALQGRSGEAYKANFTWGEGHSVDVEMPMCNGQGVVLSAKEQHDTLLVTLHREQMDTVSLGLTLLVGGRFVLGQALQNDTLEIPVAGLPAGVAQVTVYDSSSRVWADRLLFLHQDQVPASNVTVVGPTEADTLAPYGCRELRLQAEGSGVLSVSVYDRGASVTSRDNATMLTEMLLASQVNGFVEDPIYYFQKTDSAHRRHLDLLLRVQGWRRYRWEEMTQDFALREPFEVSPVIMGDMSKYLPLEQEDYFCHKPSDRLREMKSSMGMVGVSGPNLEDILESTGMGSGQIMEELTSDDKVELYSSIKVDLADFQHLSRMKKDGVVRAEYAVAVRSKNQFAQSTVPTKDGKFFIQAPHIASPFFLYLIGADQGEIRQMRLDGDDYPKYSVRVRPFFPRYVSPYNYYQVHPFEPQDGQGREKNAKAQKEVDAVALKEVEVTARKKGLGKLNLDKPVIEVDAYEAFNETVDAGHSPAWSAVSLSFTLNLVRLYIGEMWGTNRTYDLERRWNGRDATFNISQSELLKYNHLRNLYQVRIYTDYAPRLEGDPRYEASNQPSVTISLDCLPDNMERTTYRDRRYLFKGYNVCEDFYQPHYETLPPEGYRDYRRTLYWNPSVQLDEHGSATIRFYGNSGETRPVVTIEGVSECGNLLSGRQ